MTPEILQFIAKKRNCWHVAKHILEVIKLFFLFDLKKGIFFK